MLLLLNKMAVKPRLSTTKMASSHVIALNQDDAEAIALPFLAHSKDGHKSCVVPGAAFISTSTCSSSALDTRFSWQVWQVGACTALEYPAPLLRLPEVPF